jgi:hypothetical protein
MKETKFEYAGVKYKLTQVGAQCVVTREGKPYAVIPALEKGELDIVTGKAAHGNGALTVVPIDATHNWRWGKAPDSVTEIEVHWRNKTLATIYVALQPSKVGRGWEPCFLVCDEDTDTVLSNEPNFEHAMGFVDRYYNRHKMLIGLGIIPDDTPEPQDD